MPISATIKKIRTENELTQIQFAEKMNCNRQKIADWERGKSSPSADDIILLCKQFNVSADYILGLSDTPTNDKDLQFVCDYTGLSKKAVDLLKKATKLSKDIDYGESVYSYALERSFSFDFLISICLDIHIYKSYEYDFNKYKDAKKKSGLIPKRNKAKIGMEAALFRIQKQAVDFCYEISKEVPFDEIIKRKSEMERGKNGNNPQT